MFASVTSVRGGGPRIEETARMAADSMLDWLRQFDGYKGLLVLADGEAGTARIVSLWETREAADRSARARTQVRESMVAGAGVDLESVEVYEVVLDDRIG
ncbi:MAG: hypothetical protein M3304_10010 [Actinomycetota bacterium]|nr:hypothetical protein [Actinomycetota bacterium]